MKRKSIPISLITVLLFNLFFTSCMVTRTDVGQYNQQEGKRYTYSRGKQVWLFWGILPMGRTKVNTPDDGDCQVVTKYTFLDGVIYILTVGFVKTYTVKIKAKR
jgi:hypothetical protein